MTGTEKAGHLFLSFPFAQACLPYSLPINYYCCHLCSTHCFLILYSSFVFLCLCFFSSLCGLWFWELGFVQAFPSLPLKSHCKLGQGRRQLLFIPKTVFRPLSSLSQVKAHIPLERKELETLELLFWAANRGGRQ